MIEAKPRTLSLAWEDANGVRLSVRGWTDDELRLLHAYTPDEVARRVRVLPGGVAHVRDMQSTAGEFAVDASGVVFTPRFPFRAGSYSVFVDGERCGSIALDAPDPTPTAEVVAVYPSASSVPLNLLKWYVHFSAPMSEGWQRRAVQVRRADTGEPLQDVFLPGGTELWDRERTRLTLLLDPGRIKRGLLPHAQLGYPLTEGVSVVLTIDAEFEDANGTRLKTAFERRYAVGPALRSRVDPAAWRLAAPAAGSREPLAVDFDRPLDRALLERSLAIRDALGAMVEGHASIGAAEQSWEFQPGEPWKAGRYELRINALLEDLAGNSIARVFERDLTHAEDNPLDIDGVALDFVCE